MQHITFGATYRPFKIKNLNMFQQTAWANVDDVVVSKIEFTEIVE